MDEACILKGIIDVGGVKPSMYQDFSGNIFNNAIMPFTDTILMLMLRCSISGAYALFGGPGFKNGGFEFGTSVRMNAVNGVGGQLTGIVSNEKGQRVNNIRAGFARHTIHCDEA